MEPLTLHAPTRLGSPTSALQATRRLDAIARQAEIADIALPTGFHDARAALDHTRDLMREYADASADRDNPGRIADDLAAGRIDFEEAALRSMRASVAEPDGVLSQAVKQTDAAAVRQAFEMARIAVAADDLLDECRVVVSEVAEAVRKLRKPLEGITSDRDAARGGPKAAAAWAEYLRAIDRWDGAHHLAHLLRRENWITPLSTPWGGQMPDVHPGARFGRRYLRPHAIDELLALKRQQSRGRQPVPPFLHLLDPMSDAAVPGGPWTVREEAEFWEVEVERLRAQNTAVKNGRSVPPLPAPRRAPEAFGQPEPTPAATRTLPGGGVIESYEAA